MAAGRDLLLLPVRTPLGAIGHGAAVDGTFGLSALGMASLVGLFYYGYSPFSLVAGAAMDRLGPKKVLPDGRRCGRHWGTAIRFGQ